MTQIMTYLVPEGGSAVQPAKVDHLRLVVAQSVRLHLPVVLKRGAAVCEREIRTSVDGEQVEIVHFAVLQVVHCVAQLGAHAPYL